MVNCIHCMFVAPVLTFLTLVWIAENAHFVMVSIFICLHLMYHV